MGVVEEHYEKAKKVMLGNSKETQSVYTEWSEEYDASNFQHLGLMSPLYGAQALVAALGENVNSAAVLDIAAGTGQVGYHLRKDFSFHGKIDIHDANMEMLLLATRKNLNFRTIIRHFVLADGELPVRDDSYDAITCMSSFLPNHLPQTTVLGALRALKKGGFFIFNLRSKHAEQYNESFKSMLQQLEASGNIEVVAKVNLPHFKNFGDHTYTSDVFTIKKL